MARPIKGGISYFPLDCTFLGDKKVKMVRGRFGSKGVHVMIALLSEIYSGEGYYKQWDDDDSVLMSEDVSCGVSPDLVTQVVQECLKRSFFHEGVFKRFGVLTSHGIQKRYVRACENRDEIRFYEEYFLLDPMDKDDVPRRLVKKLSLKSVFGTGNPIESTDNQAKSNDNPLKEKDSKQKEQENTGDAPAREDEDENGNPVIDPAWKAVSDCFLSNLGMLGGGTKESDLMDFTAKMGADIVCLAIQATKEMSPENPLPYVLKVLMNWQKAGVKTLQHAQSYLDDYKRKMSGRKNAPTQGTGNGFLDMLNGGAGSGS